MIGLNPLGSVFKGGTEECDVYPTFMSVHPWNSLNFCCQTFYVSNWTLLLFPLSKVRGIVSTVEECHAFHVTIHVRFERHQNKCTLVKHLSRTQPITCSFIILYFNRRSNSPFTTTNCICHAHEEPLESPHKENHRKKLSKITS